MIVAVLEDKKGFKKSMDIAKFVPYIKIAVPPNLPTVVYFGEGKGEITIETLEFRFQKWLLDNEIALYKEKEKS